MRSDLVEVPPIPPAEGTEKAQNGPNSPSRPHQTDRPETAGTATRNQDAATVTFPCVLCDGRPGFDCSDCNGLGFVTPGEMHDHECTVCGDGWSHDVSADLCMEWAAMQSRPLAVSWKVCPLHEEDRPLSTGSREPGGRVVEPWGGVDRAVRFLRRMN